MNTRRFFTLALAVLSWAPAFAQGQLHQDSSDCGAVAGSYFVSKLDENGNLADPEARALLSLVDNGVALFTDAAEGGGPDYAPFSDAKGSWSCAKEGDNGVVLRVLVFDFTLPNQAGQKQEIARLDSRVVYDATTHGLSGRTEIFFIDIAGDPLLKPDSDARYHYTFDARKIEAPVE